MRDWLKKAYAMYHFPPSNEYCFETVFWVHKKSLGEPRLFSVFMGRTLAKRGSFQIHTEVENMVYFKLKVR